jgi:hypothetical protein
MRSGSRALALLTFLLSSCVANTNSGSTQSLSPPTPASTGTAPVTASSALTPRPTAPITAHENPFLGYRITLPSTYRRLPSSYFTADKATGGLLGRDAYTLLTEEQEREECLQDLGDLPPRTANLLLLVESYVADPAVSASDWASTPRIPGAQSFAMHRRIVALTLPGLDAIKLVADNATAETQVVVVHATDRMYMISPTMGPAPHSLEDIAATFATVARQPVPTPSPSPAANIARANATELAALLGAAFTARDADAVARLMDACRIGVSPVIDETQGLPNSGGGGLGRSVALFAKALRDRFAAGDLSVAVGSGVELDARGSYFVRSQWKEPDRTLRIDLVMSLIGDAWRWTAARQYFTRADLGSPICIPYRSPWVSPNARC